MKFAVLADLHLTDRADTVKENVLDWALACIKAEQVDCIVSAGDLTAVGTVPAARRIMEKIRATGIPFIGTAGNAELRTPDQAEEVLNWFDGMTKTIPTWYIHDMVTDQNDRTDRNSSHQTVNDNIK